MADIPYTPTPKNVIKFFNIIQDIGVPPKMTVAQLKSIGLTSSNDTYLIRVAKSLGFIDKSGIPTQVWKDYRDKSKAPNIMASALKNGYPELFGTYQDADKRDDATIQNFIASTTQNGSAVVKLMTATFRNLCSLAEFNESSAESNDNIEKNPPKPKIEQGITQPVTINVNIQLQLPATEDPTIYENMFKALKNNLLS
ncbi:MAG: DUF5343 domain-containing protein [Dehalococcoidales bacterium]|nr:DUF5343 domain-containing protein [Dehalococcoidales bacterium]